MLRESLSSQKAQGTILLIKMQTFSKPSSPRRILIHGINYAPELVGIGKYTGELGAYLASRGHRVTVLTAPPYYPQWRIHDYYRPQRWQREALEGVEVLRAPHYVPARVTSRGRLLQEVTFWTSCLFWWLSYLLRQPWDALLAVCPPLHSGLIPGILARRRGIPLVIQVQDLQLDAARELGMLRQPGLLALLTCLERFVFGQAQAVVTVSQTMAARIRDKGIKPERLHVLPNWADLDAIRPGRRQNQFRKELGLKSEVVVLYSGNLGEKQGLEIILEAAALTRGDPGIKYLIAGEGAVKTRLAAQAENLGLENLAWLPLQSIERFSLLLAAADIHLVVQRQKAADLLMPSKLANILAAGRPFVVTALPDTELGQIINDSGAGILVPPEDPAALAQAVLALSADPPARRRMGARARRYAESFLGREEILACWENLLSGLSLVG